MCNTSRFANVISYYIDFTMLLGRGLTIVGSVIKGDYLIASTEVDEYEEVNFCHLKLNLLRCSIIIWFQYCFWLSEEE